jgi:hypothetical protein
MAWDRHTADMDFQQITLRRAVDCDRRALTRLAQLDSTRLPDDDFLLGEVAGEPWAAIGIQTGVVVADPFRPTADLEELLRMRAESAHAAPAPHWRRLLRRGESTSARVSARARR